jgi:hypothetical protein
MFQQVPSLGLLGCAIIEHFANTIMFTKVRSVLMCIYAYCSLFVEVKCPVCARGVGGTEDPEIHLIMCLTRPRIPYNGRSVYIHRAAKASKVKRSKSSCCIKSYMSSFNFKPWAYAHGVLGSTLPKY